MLIRTVTAEEKAQFNSVVTHPLQSWEWGEFRKKTGLAVERVGIYENSRLTQGFQITFHPIPIIGKTLGYLPKSSMPDDDQLDVLKQLGRQHNSLFIKMEPNIARIATGVTADDVQAEYLAAKGAVPGRPLFTKYSFQLDLRPTEEELYQRCHTKTRYNVSLASRKGVVIYENTTRAGMEQHLEILQETTKRQGFYAHTPEYFRTMWEAMGSSSMLRIFEAHFEGKVLVSWIVFVFNGWLYYPYGASRSIHREVMASNLMMWEMIRLGKTLGCHHFDMWGSLGPDPDAKSPWFGFHKFKQGYGGVLMEFMGTYDLVLDPPKYQLYKVAESVRWKWLRLQAKLHR